MRPRRTLRDFLISASILMLSASAIADDDVTIRMMEMDEVAPDAVMNMIMLPVTEPADERHTTQTKSNRDEMTGNSGDHSIGNFEREQEQFIDREADMINQHVDRQLENQNNRPGNR